MKNFKINYFHLSFLLQINVKNVFPSSWVGLLHRKRKGTYNFYEVRNWWLNRINLLENLLKNRELLTK
jgi:hypothetical protein